MVAMYGFLCIFMICVFVVMAVASLLWRLARRLYYALSGKTDPNKDFVIRYQVSGTYTVRLRATDVEKAKKRAALLFEDKERFGDLESPEIVSCIIENESEKTQVSEIEA